GSLEGKKAFVIGAGKISRLSIEYLLEEGLAEIYHTNRTHGRVKEIFKEFSSLKPVEYKNRYEILKKVDILITATGAPHTIISYEDMPELKNKLHIMDLAIPRDVDDRIRENKKVILYHIDDLKKVSHDNLLEREKLSKEAMAIISEDVDKYMEWLSHTKVDPVIES
ncbi:MAG: glutamyl-tRNA reductase, partial [Tissierellia bacterium]|nr:glutamyl-tRNA reductase [Tissierellia bacterium]